MPRTSVRTVDEVCHEWRTWGEVLHVPFRPVKAFVQYLIYIIFSVGAISSSSSSSC